MSRRSEALILVHVVWATFSRRPLLPESFDAELIRNIELRTHRACCELLVAGCAADHVHAVFRLAPSIALSELMQQVKGGSAYDANQLARLAEPLRWQAGYWAESVSPSVLQPLAEYVRAQRARHDAAHRAERWQHE